MNWQAIRFDWNQVRAFLATAEEGSLSAAGRALALTQPTVGRQVSGLEESLGVSLFERAGRGLVLTGTGRDLLEHVRVMGEAATQVSLIASGRSETIAGRVSISVADAMAAYIMPDILVGLAQHAPEIEVEMVVTNALSDLLRREADIALRHVRPEVPDLVAIRIRTGTGGLYAAPSFLERYGVPQRVEDITDLPFIGLAEPSQMVPVLRAYGIPVSEANFHVFSGNTVVGWELVKRGLGIGIMSEDIASRTPEVIRILPEFTPVPVELWLTTHRELRTSARIRLVFDYLAEALKGDPQRCSGTMRKAPEGGMERQGRAPSL